MRPLHTHTELGMGEDLLQAATGDGRGSWGWVDPKSWVDASCGNGGRFPSPVHGICLLSLSQHEQAKRLWFMSSRGMVSYSGKNIPAGISCLLLYQHRADKASQCWQATAWCMGQVFCKSGEAPASPPVGAESPGCVLGAWPWDVGQVRAAWGEDVNYQVSQIMSRPEDRGIVESWSGLD